MSILIDIDHEAGDVAEYTSTTTSGGATFAASLSAGLAYTAYGAAVTLDGGGGDTAYGTAAISPPASTIIRARFYIDPNGLTIGDGENFTVFRLFTSSSTNILTTALQYVSGTGYQLVTRCTDDDADIFTLATTTITDAPHYVEVYLQKATGAADENGVCTYWIDGAQVGTKINFDCYSRFADMATVDIGAILLVDAGTSGTFYIDQLVVNDTGELIGPWELLRAAPGCFDGPSVF